MDKLIDKIIEQMKASNSLTDDDEIVRMGLEIIIMKAIFIIAIVILGLLLHCVVESMVFAVSFTLLRQYSGGYHAETRKKCFIYSLITLIVALVIIKLATYLPYMKLLLFVISYISSVYIFVTAPIDTESNRLDEIEIKVYGRRARVITTLLLILSTVLYVLKLDNYSITVITGIIIEAYLMLAGKIKNIRKGELYE